MQGSKGARNAPRFFSIHMNEAESCCALIKYVATCTWAFQFTRRNETNLASFPLNFSNDNRSTILAGRALGNGYISDC